MYNIHKSKLMSLVVFISTIILSTSSYAIDIPQQISYQGKLLESGVAVDDTKSMTFSLGSSWTETHESVTIDNGLYSVQLGSINPIPLSTFASSSTVNLEISVEGENLTPTLDVLSVAYAFVAENAKDADKLNGNEASYYLDWANIANIPAGFADGIDNEGEGGSADETDPIFSSSSAKNITSSNIDNWNSAVSWGNHASASYLTSESDPVWSSVAANYYTKSQISAVGTSNSYNDLSDKPVIPDTSNFVALTGTQTISGNKTFAHDLVTNDIQMGSSTNSADVVIYGDLELYDNEIRYFEIDHNNEHDAILKNPNGGKFRINDTLYLQYSDTSSWLRLEVGDININDGHFLDFYNNQGDKRGQIWGDGYEGSEQLTIKVENSGTIKLNGNVYATASAKKPGGGAWDTSSDRRLKDIGKNYENGLDDVNAIEPIYYNYKKDNPLKLPSEETYVGVIAQEIQKVIPEAVDEDKNGYLTVNNDPIIWAMLNAIKELSSEVSALKMELKIMKEETK